MKKIITFIFLLISINFFGQILLEEKEIIGKWKVVDTKITMKGAINNENIIKTKEGFINSIFHFGGNGIFNIYFKENVPWFFKELKSMSLNNWKYEKNSNSIKIGTEKDNFTIMQISPFKKAEKYFFSIDGFIFEVDKISTEEKSFLEKIKEKKNEKIKPESPELKIQNIEKSEIILYEMVEKNPSYSKCKSKNEEENKKCFKKELYKHFGEKFNPSLPSELGLVSGTHKIENTFIINKNGEVVNIESTGTNEKLNNECKRVLSLLPKMKPGIHNGITINVKYEIPFTIKVE